MEKDDAKTKWALFNIGIKIFNKLVSHKKNYVIAHNFKHI